MDPRRTSPRTKRLPKVVPDTDNTEMKKGLGSRKRTKLANNNAGRWQQQRKKGKWNAPIYLHSSSNNISDYNVPKAN
jgi:hypothetical protein